MDKKENFFEEKTVLSRDAKRNETSFAHIPHKSLMFNAMAPISLTSFCC